MTFLRFGGYKATTLSTAEKSSVHKGFQFWRFRFGLFHHHFLSGIKKFWDDSGNLVESKSSLAAL
jgi:hypothetical protein